jgi:hypothetical protein
MWHTELGKVYGLRAEMSIWGSPNQEYSQESGAAIQIYCSDGGKYSLIEAGYHVQTYQLFLLNSSAFPDDDIYIFFNLWFTLQVSPSLYRNRDVRFFTYSTVSVHDSPLNKVLRTYSLEVSMQSYNSLKSLLD